MGMPPELASANQERDAAKAELDAAKRENDLKTQTAQDRVNIDAAVTPVRRQTEHQLNKATELRDRVRGRGPKARPSVFTMDKIAEALEKSAVGGGGMWPRTYGPPKPYKPNPARSKEPNIYNNREMALDEIDSMYGDQTKPITSGTDWATKGIQNRHQQQIQKNRAMGYPDNAQTLGGAWNKWVVNPHQYMAGTLADLGQNMWAGAGKNVAGNYAAGKAGWEQMHNQVAEGGLGNLNLGTLKNWWGDTWRTAANVTPFGMGGFQDPRQRQRDAAAKAQAEAAAKQQELAAQQAAAAPVEEQAPQPTQQGPNNFQDLMSALLPFLGMNNQVGGWDTYGSARPDYSGDFVNLMRVLGNMNRAGNESS